MIKNLIPFLFFIFALSSFGQNLKSGFDKDEYVELLKLTSRNSLPPDSAKKIPFPNNFKLEYRSPVVGLDNVWELWSNEKGTAVISVRGSTKNTESWLANFYAAMVPAKGILKLSKDDLFDYELAQNPKAAVHVGWLLSTAYLSKTILPKIDSCYRRGIKNFLVTGHSQGGGISYLLTAYLYNLQRKSLLPADIRLKTYCSAAPKPGNLFFAYDYEKLTQNGWAYNVVNANDWVPEMVLSVQTVEDFNTVNPFIFFKSTIKKQKFPKNLVLRYFYNKMDKPSRKAQRYYQKYLGNKLSDYVRKYLPEFEPPVYFKTSNYVRTGNTIVLDGEEEYFKQYPNSKEKIMIHHQPEAYLYLAEHAYN